ncbi:hypothetical protein NC653_038324 [Populus alba x Populus x berolinensis]|uniref:Uncharacterized protein n=1 Tax=Populus alba x Populus x berolinensis TaxID=444605 RepID=A0AAD6LGF2_9ROSI|nr:hypothetical protein NC653_038324 [Populus alba x Populus x berolinensis]
MDDHLRSRSHPIVYNNPLPQNLHKIQHLETSQASIDPPKWGTSSLESMQFYDDSFLLRCYLASLKSRPKVIHPPQPAALTTPVQTW